MKKYIDTFYEIQNGLGQKLLSELGLACEVGHWKNAAVLKLQKQNWSQGGFGEGIFFSIWMEPKDKEKKQVLYNIHALKHRLMEGYEIKSNEFADSFRKAFVEKEITWPNVSLKYGPQTLMQGWIPLVDECFRNDVESLVLKFVEIHSIIDRMLEERKVIQ